MVDWELSTLGDPVADVAMMCAYRHPALDLVLGCPRHGRATASPTPTRSRGAYESRVRARRWPLGLLPGAGLLQARRDRRGHRPPLPGAAPRPDEGFDAAGDAVPEFLEAGLAVVDGPMADRVALVTGASRGIGLGIAQAAGRAGFGLTITARDPRAARPWPPPTCAAAAHRTSWRSLGTSRTTGYPDQLVDAHAEAFGTLTCLVLNAGVGTAGEIGDVPDAPVRQDHRRQPPSPVRPAAGGAAAAAARRRSRIRARGARVIVLASITGVHAEAGLAAYGATKAALISLVETLNTEESGHGVSATAIAPGYVDTDMSAWVQDRIPPETMIPVSDIVELVDALLDLSPRSMVGRDRRRSRRYVRLRRLTKHGMQPDPEPCRGQSTTGKPFLLRDAEAPVDPGIKSCLGIPSAVRAVPANRGWAFRERGRRVVSDQSREHLRRQGSPRPVAILR